MSDGDQIDAVSMCVSDEEWAQIQAREKGIRSPEEVAREILGCDVEWDEKAGAMACYTYHGEGIECGTEEHRVASVIRARDIVIWEAGFKAAEEHDCTCGFGGFHDDVNPRCDKNKGGTP